MVKLDKKSLKKTQAQIIRKKEKEKEKEKKRE